MNVDRVRVGEVLRLERVPAEPDPTVEYISIGIRSFGKGIFHYEPKLGNHLGSLRFFEVQPDRLIVSNIKGWEGAIAVSSPSDAGHLASNRFLSYAPIDDQIDINWARWFFLSEPGIELIQRASPGSADRNRTLAIDRFEAMEIPLPAMDTQRRVAARISLFADRSAELRKRHERTMALSNAVAASASTRWDLDDLTKARAGWRRGALGECLTPSRRQVSVDSGEQYQIAGIYSFGRGLIDRGSISGTETSYKMLTALDEGDVVFSKLNGWEGAVAVVELRFAGYFVSSEFPTFKPDRTQLLSEFFRGIARSPWFWDALNTNTRGSMVRRRRINSTEFLSTEVWLPPTDEQARLAQLLSTLVEGQRLRRKAIAIIDALLPAALNEAFAGLS